MKEFLREIECRPPDVILSDHGLPSFDGFTALSIAREKCPDTPFIFVTGSMGEEVAINPGATLVLGRLAGNRGPNPFAAGFRELRVIDQRAVRGKGLRHGVSICLPSGAMPGASRVKSRISEFFTANTASLSKY